MLRRVTSTGVAIGDTDLRAAGLSAEGLLVGRAQLAAGTIAWYWDAFAHRIVRVDIATGQVLASTTVSIPGAVTPGAVEQLGQAIATWIAPAAAAKFYLDPSIVVSPDGSRVYVIGSSSTSFVNGTGGSAGVWTLDGTTLAVVGWWAPVADYVSIGISGDGSRIFALGEPGVDTAGDDAPYQASVTVIDAATGQVRLVAGQLGSDTLMVRRVLEP